MTEDRAGLLFSCFCEPNLLCELWCSADSLESLLGLPELEEKDMKKNQLKGITEKPDQSRDIGKEKEAIQAWKDWEGGFASANVRYKKKIC